MMKNGVYFIRIALVSCILKVIVNFNSVGRLLFLFCFQKLWTKDQR